MSELFTVLTFSGDLIIIYNINLYFLGYVYGVA